jgi:hypothetical protein
MRGLGIRDTFVLLVYCIAVFLVISHAHYSPSVVTMRSERRERCKTREGDVRFLMIGFRNLPSFWNCTFTLPGFSKSAGWVLLGCESAKVLQQSSSSVSPS